MRVEVEIESTINAAKNYHIPENYHIPGSYKTNRSIINLVIKNYITMGT